MKRLLKTFAAILTSAAVIVSMTGCSFSIGTKSKEEKYEDIFIDAPKSNFHSNLQYVFKLENHGKMNVWVDTTNGHKFELKSENAGFDIQDKNGNAVLNCACITKENYERFVADIEEVKTVNGRDFFYRENGDGSLDLFSYMADCGIDGGLVMETRVGFDAFRLVAFRGTAIEGASSDIYAYKPKTTTTEQTTPAETAAPETTVTETTTAPETTAESPAPETTAAQQALTPDKLAAALDSDYGKINWGITYNVSEAYPGIYISVAPYKLYDDYCLVIGVTSLYDEPVSIAANAYAKDKDGNQVGDTFFFFPNISKGMTAVNMIYCDEGKPDGSIHWEDFEVIPSSYKKGVSWAADLKATGKYEDGVLTAEYNLYSSGNEAMTPGDVTVVLTDENGNITGIGIDYVADEIKAGETYRGSINIYQDSTILSYTKDITMFTSPTAPVE